MRSPESSEPAAPAAPATSDDPDAPVPDTDVPMGIDLRTETDATVWAAEADAKRPWRTEIRAAFADLVRGLAPLPHVLELGPGPGLLADAVLAACPVASYTLFDFSPPMLEMSRRRLAGRPAVHYVLGDFARPDWPAALAPPFDAVLAMQSVHEIRHKRHMPRLYAQVHAVLRPGGLLAVCDHLPLTTAVRHRALNSTVAEQHAALASAGFVDIATPLELHRMYLCTARRPA